MTLFSPKESSENEEKMLSKKRTEKREKIEVQKSGKMEESRSLFLLKKI